MSPCECNHSSRRSLPQIPERYGPQLERTLCLGSSGKLIWSGVPYQRAYIPVFRVYILFLYIMKLVFEFMACLCLFAMRLGSKVERLTLIIVPFERLTCVFLRYPPTIHHVACDSNLHKLPPHCLCTAALMDSSVSLEPGFSIAPSSFASGILADMSGARPHRHNATGLARNA